MSAKDFTLLLLGESGVGKSTFINAFVNYMTYETMDEVRGQPLCVIPVSFTVTDPQTYEPMKVTFGGLDANENTDQPYKSGTEYPKCYKFINNNITLNIIDTPGIADTEGVDKDNKNMDILLDFISNYRDINAICVLLKPNNTKVSVVFKYCLLQLFSHLNKSAADNILFLFTNARSTHYAPGDSGPVLESILKDLRERPPNVDIKYSTNTIYCFDNESFRYLVATVPPNNMKFSEDNKIDYNASWDRSVKECKRMFDYIRTLRPYNIRDTLSLNSAKQVILLLSQPLADIAKNIADNQIQCEARKRRILECESDINKLQVELYVPQVDIISTPLPHPKLVCTDTSCCTRRHVQGTSVTQYDNECQYTTLMEYENEQFNVGIGYGKFLFGASQSQTKSSQKVMCLTCGHGTQSHRYIRYENKVQHRQVRDETKQQRITSVSEAAEAQRSQLEELEVKIGELTRESNIIVKCMARFAYFLAQNSLTRMDDHFERHIQQLIDDEVNTGAISDDDSSKVIVGKLKQLLDSYNCEKQLIINALKSMNANEFNISLDEIQGMISELCGLKWTGSTIVRLMEMQRCVQVRGHTRVNVVSHSVPDKAAVFSKLNVY